jgi:hypothetical protein
MEVSEFLGAYNWNNALIAARNYIGGGFSDWRLPSKDELNLIYINLGTRNIGNLGHSYHWSSTQFNTESAWVQMLIGGSEQGTNYKRNAVSVRAVRDF